MVKFGIHCFNEALRWALSFYLLSPFLYIFLVYAGLI